MESCPFPIKVCENIIDAVDWTCLREQRDALRHCALTCRAWRTRAQRRLWEMPSLDATSLNKFIERIHDNPVHLTSLINTIKISFEESDGICRMNELLLKSIPNLRTLEIRCATYSASLNLQSIYPKVLRARPPLLTHVTKLKLSACRFGWLRGMFDMVWACPNLSSLELSKVGDFLVEEPVTEDATQILVSACNNLKLRACTKLENLDIDLSHLNLDGLYPLFNEGCLFGTHVTSLKMDVGMDGLQKLTNFLPGVFPELTTLRVVINFEQTSLNSSPSVLRMLAERTAEPAKCKSVVLHCSFGSHAKYDGQAAGHCRYCDYLVGSAGDPELATESQDTLLKRFSSLETLRIVIDDAHVEGCAAHIESMLSNLRASGLLTVSREGD